MLSVFIYLIFGIIFFSAICVILAKNPVHSILFLILVFCSSSVLLLYLDVDFLALMFIVVYVGAIAVLFLFVVMLLNIKIIELNYNFIQYIPVLLILLFVFFLIFLLHLEISFHLFERFFIRFSFFEDLNYYFFLINWSVLFYNIPNIEVIGEVLYTYFFSLFFLVANILLIAMIGSIVLTLNKIKKSLKQNIFEQNLRRWSDSISLFR